jgi:hypothetical protein
VPELNGNLPEMETCSVPLVFRHKQGLPVAEYIEHSSHDYYFEFLCYSSSLIDRLHYTVHGQNVNKACRIKRWCQNVDLSYVYIAVIVMLHPLYPGYILERREPGYLSRYSDRLRAGRPGTCSRQRPNTVRTADCFTGTKRPGREADHSPQFSVEVKNGGAIPPLPLKSPCFGA